jgi:hypothetical protein
MTDRPGYNYIERRKHVCLSDDQMKLLVDTVSEEVVNRVQSSLKDMMYKELGKSIAEQIPGMLGGALEKMLWLLGAIGLAVFVYLNTHGFNGK